MNLEIKNKENPFTDFKMIAEQLLNNSILIVGEANYRFTTLEFYYWNERDKHIDVYSHKHNYQKTYGQWYFHGSGLDITFGEKDIYGGILIRGIQNIQNGEYINGPLLCVQEIFKNFGNVGDPKSKIYVGEYSHSNMKMEYENVYYSPRVGLNPAKDKDDLRFYNALYRFFINPQKTQKDKSDIADHLLKQVKLSKNLTAEALVNRLFGYKHFKE